MKLSTIIAIAMISTFATSAAAITGFKKDEWVSGQHKYCEYTNGVIITIKSYKLCPLSVDE